MNLRLFYLSLLSVLCCADPIAYSYRSINVMEALMNNVFVVDESVPMVKSVKAVLDSDGYLVQILNPTLFQEQLNEVPDSVVDALSSIRTVRNSFPRMSQIVLVPISHS